MIKCNMFEDNESCVRIAKPLILTPRTKHIDLEHRQFRSQVEDSAIIIEAIRKGEQNADALTKPVEDPQFSYLRKKYNGH